MATNDMSDIPDGFELESSAPAAGLPEGFELEGTAPAKPNWNWSQLGSMAINDILNLPSNLYQGIKSAVTLPGDVVNGERVVPQSANMPGGENTSEIPAVTNLAGMGVRSAPGTFGKPMAPTETQLEAAKNAQYSAAEKIPIELSPKAMDLLGRNIKTNLGIDPALADKTFKVLDGLSDYYDKGSVNVQNLRTIQRSLGEIKNNSADKTERLVARRSLDTFNYFLGNLDQVPGGLTKGTPGDAAEFASLIKEANGNNTALENSRAFSQRGQNAQFEAASANSGMNLENRLRAQVTQILKNPKLQRGLDGDTVEALKDFNGGSRTANTMRLVGNLLGGGGGLSMLVAGGVGHLLGVPPETFPAVGTALKSVSNQAAFNKFTDIGNMIRANSPLARSGEISLQGGGLLGRPRITIPLSPQNTSQQ